MSAITEADAICSAPYGPRSEERTNSRNGYGPGVGHLRRHDGGGDPKRWAGAFMPSGRR